MEIGKRLRELRTAKRMSIYRLSLLTGISQNHINHIELNQCQPSVLTLDRLLQPLGITLSEFFYDGGEVSVLTPEERALLETVRSLPPETAEALIRLAEVISR